MSVLMQLQRTVKMSIGPIIFWIAFVSTYASSLPPVDSLGKDLKDPVVTANADKIETFEGDMVLSPEQKKWLKQADITKGLGHNLLKSGRVDEKYRWPGNILYYDFDSSVTAAHQKKVKTTLKELQKKLGNCVKFQKRTDGRRVIVRSKHWLGCRSWIGYQYYRTHQHLNLKHPGCMHTGIIEHEFLHALGVYHEQSRSDRDRYVIIKWNNIMDQNKHNFNKYSEDVVHHYDLPYDYRSVMHYGASDFTKNGKKTIITKDPKMQDVIGQRSGVTAGDIALVKKMYKCLGSCTPKPNSWRGGDCSNYVWACTDSSFPWYKKLCSTTCNYCEN